jgi:uncharacterized membrane protein YgcG
MRSAPFLHITPAAEINAQYNRFLADFRTVEQAYVTAINSQTNNTVSVSSILTAPYVVSTPQLLVQNGAVFGPDGGFSTPVTAIASINSVPVATFVLTGRSGNTLLLDPSQLPSVSVPAGTVLSATIPASTQTSAAAIFPAYIANRTGQLAIDLVSFFNQTKVKLPYYNAPPHTPNTRGAIQTFVYQQTVGTAPTSLQQLLLNIPLPTTSGSDLVIYDAAVNSAVEQSRRATLDGVRQIFAGTKRIPSPTIGNRLGIPANGGSSGSGSTTGTGGSTTGSSSSSSNGGSTG